MTYSFSPVMKSRNTCIHLEMVGGDVCWREKGPDANKFKEVEFNYGRKTHGETNICSEQLCVIRGGGGGTTVCVC